MGTKLSNKIKTIDVQAKEWFDKIAGNSYFSAVATIDFGLKSEKHINVPFQYGYGEAYLSQTFDQLQKDGILPNDETIYSPTMWCRDKGIVLRYSKKDKCLKRETVAFSM